MRIENLTDSQLERLANTKLAELGGIWAEVDKRGRDSIKRDWRRAMAVHDLPGSYHSSDLPARPLSLRRESEQEADVEAVGLREPILQST
jgi:hypothetical protein